MTAGVQTNYGAYYTAGTVLAAALFLPGWALRRRFPGSIFGRLEHLPLAGMGLMAAAGGVSCWLGPGRHWKSAWLLAVAELIFLGWGLTAPRKLPDPAPGAVEGAKRVMAGAYVLLVLAAGTAAALRIPVTQEYWGGTSMQSRMVASPPDNVIPYRTAAYLYQRHRDAATSERFFWQGWSGYSRGPLVPLMIRAAFDVARPQLEPGGDPGPGPWPAGPDRFYLARWLGLLTNAAVLFGAAGLLGALGASPRAVRWGTIWMALAPAVWINTVFVWPKLLAVYFLLLATTYAIQPCRRWHPLLCGLALTAAYTAHPLGALFAPIIILVAFQQQGPRFGLLAAVAAACAAAPWIAMQSHAREPNMFLRYPWGDGRGFLAAASLQSWCRCRWNNLWQTLAPGAFYLSPAMRVWLDGPLTPTARWVVQAAKTLPAGIGFSCLLLPIAAWRKARRPFAVIGAALALATLYWGFSDDGLGRNCLLPITVGVIICSSARTDWNRRLPRLLVGLLAVETAALVIAGFTGSGAPH